MPLPILVDSNILSKLVRPDLPDYRPVAETVDTLQEDSRFEILIPEIIDDEFRRKLLHLAYRPHQALKWARLGLTLLDRMTAEGYIALNTETMNLAATLWAETRARGVSRVPEEHLDVDVILAAQARIAGGHILTLNDKHFDGLAPVFDWKPYQPQ